MTILVRMLTFWGPGTLSLVSTWSQKGVPVHSGLLSPLLVLKHQWKKLVTKVRWFEQKFGVGETCKLLKIQSTTVSLLLQEHAASCSVFLLVLKNTNSSDSILVLKRNLYVYQQPQTHIFPCIQWQKSHLIGLVRSHISDVDLYRDVLSGMDHRWTDGDVTVTKLWVWQSVAERIERIVTQVPVCQSIGHIVVRHWWNLSSQKQKTNQINTFF